MAVTYDAFELSCLSMSNVSIALLPFFSGVPYFAYKSSIRIGSFVVSVGFVKTESYSAKISSSKSSCFVKIDFAVLNPCSSSLINTQSDELLAVLRFATLFTVLLMVFTVPFSVVPLFGCIRVDFVLNLNFPNVLAGAGTSAPVAILLDSFSLRDINLKSDDCFDILLT